MFLQGAYCCTSNFGDILRAAVDFVFHSSYDPTPVGTFGMVMESVMDSQKNACYRQLCTIDHICSTLQDIWLTAVLDAYIQYGYSTVGFMTLWQMQDHKSLNTVIKSYREKKKI